MADDQWGPGDLEKAHSIGWTTIGDEKDSGTLELFWGEHPHVSRTVSGIGRMAVTPFL